MTRFSLFPLIIITASTAFLASASCHSRAPGYYCVDTTHYEWCPDAGEPAVLTCPVGRTCVCGQTVFNPCSADHTPPPDCLGEPGDFADQHDDPSTPTTQPLAGLTESKKLVTYFTSWPQYHTNTLNGQSCKYTPANIDASSVTHINYAFLVINSQYQVVNYEWNDFDFIKQIVALKATTPRLKVFASIGGWNFNLHADTKDLFGRMASTKANRAKFIASCIAICRQYNLDGIDIDWEYPGVAAQGGQPEDTPNYTLLIRELRAAFDAAGTPRLGLTIAAPAGYDKFAFMEVAKFHQSVDWFNLMTYDYHGSWEDVTGPNTPLYSADRYNINHTVGLYIRAGVAPSKLLLGLATYGRVWTLASATGRPAYGAAATGGGTPGVCTQEASYLNSYEIKDLVARGAHQTDARSVTEYGWQGDQFVTYDTLATHQAKVQWACRMGLGGVFLWDLADDDAHEMHKQAHRLISASSCRSGSSQ